MSAYPKVELILFPGVVHLNQPHYQFCQAVSHVRGVPTSRELVGTESHVPIGASLL